MQTPNYRKPAGGPRTQEGKKRCSGNSRKHGLYAKHDVEQDEAWEHTCSAVSTDCHAEGVVERMLCRQLTQNLWEREKIDDYAREQHLLKRLGLNQLVVNKAAFHDGSRPNGKGSGAEGAVSEPVCVQADRPAQLSEIKTNIQKRGLDAKTDLKELHQIYGETPTEVGLFVAALYTKWEERSQLELDAEMRKFDQEWVTEQILHFLDSEIVFQKEFCSMLEDLQHSARPKAFIPSDVIQEKIARARANNDRSQKRILESLETAKRLKRLE